MNTKDILWIALPALAILAVYQFSKNAVPGAVTAFNNSTAGQALSAVGTVAGGVTGIVQTASDLSLDQIGDLSTDFYP